MDEFTEMLQTATSKIDPRFFQLPIDGGPAVFRERVYCYELYHQLRSVWPTESSYTLNGEVDKVAHPILSQLGADPISPDFLVHRPGDMEGNYCVIEVKPTRSGKELVLRDVRKLQRFKSAARYQRAICIVYGCTPHTESWLHELMPESDSVEIWWHAQVQSAAIRLR